jgi:hypothetical protein
MNIMRNWHPKHRMTEIEYIEWIIDLFFLTGKAEIVEGERWIWTRLAKCC